MSEPHDQRDDLTQGEDVSNEALTQALKGGFYILYLVITALLVYFFISNWFRLNAGETAVVLRFGKPLQTTNADLLREGKLHFAWPFPIDEKVIVDGGRQSVASTIGWYAASKMRNPEFKVMDDGYLIGKDLNIIHVQAELDYRVDDPTKYNFGFYRNLGKDSSGDDGEARLPVVERILQSLLDNALARTIPNYDGEELALGGAAAEEFRSKVEMLAAESVKTYDLGVVVEGVRLASGADGVGAITWPRGMPKRMQAILEQNQNTYQADVAFARDRAAKMVDTAKAAAKQQVDEAKREADDIVERVKAEYDEFNKIYDRSDGDDQRILTELVRLRNERLMSILKSENVRFVVVPTQSDGSRKPIDLTIPPPPPRKPKATEIGGPPKEYR